MITPSKWLLIVVAVVFVPACLLPAFSPGSGEFYLGLIALVLVLVATADLLLSRKALAGLVVTLPTSVRATQDVDELLSAMVTLSGNQSASELLLAVAFPSEIEAPAEQFAIRPPTAGHTVRVDILFKGPRRGEWSISQAFLGCGSKLKLWEMRRTVPVTCKILVHPSLPDIFQDAARLLRSHSQGVQRLVSRSGKGREIEQLRAYAPHDDFGDIDWKATARHRSPIVREYRIERTQEIYCCVDYSRLSGRIIQTKAGKNATILDEYIRSALLLHRVVHQTGDKFGLMTFGETVGYFLKATNPSGMEPVLRKALYPLQPQKTTPAFQEACSLLRSNQKRRALVVFFTSLAEPQLAESLLTASRVLAHQHLVVMACPTDASVQPLFSTEDAKTNDDVYERLAGHLLWKRLAEVRLQLAKIKVNMNLVAPGKLGLVAATEYLSIKERQLL